MKLSIFLLLAMNVAFASKSVEWTPKYKKSQTKKMDLELLTDRKVAKSTRTKSSAKKKISIIPATPLEALYLKKAKKKEHLNKLKHASLKLKQKAVPTLLKVIKSNNYPEENRWVAIHMLGRIMGKKSAPYISKFSKHSNWMLKLASLKVLLHLNQKQYKGIYARLLEDKSLIVRHQALQNIKEMKLTSLAPYVWKMLYNKSNYVGLKGKRKRSSIIKDAIKTVGDLGFKKARKPMLEMFRKKKYVDVYSELDYSLSKLEGKASPAGGMSVKKHYWNRIGIKEITI